MDGVDTVESEGFLVVGCLAVGQRISGARRLPFSPSEGLFDLIYVHHGERTVFPECQLYKSARVCVFASVYPICVAGSAVSQSALSKTRLL